jgi:GxxExxY protein
MTDTRHLNDPETYAIIGAAMAVHTELGCGFLEAVYKAALTIEMRRRAIPFEREVGLPIVYKGEPLPLSYRVDFVCVDAVIVEVKPTTRSPPSTWRRPSTTCGGQGSNAACS